MRSMCKVLVVFAALFAVSAGCLADSIEKVGENAKIDWTNHYYIVQGHGAMPSATEEPNRARAKLKAKDYAKMDALANLLMLVEGTTISFEATGKDYMSDTTIRQKIEGFVRNAQVTNYWIEEFEGDTISVVEIRAPMFARDAPGTVFLQEKAGRQGSGDIGVRVVAKPDKVTAATPATVLTPSDPLKPFTGLIVDASGYMIDRSMSPKIRRTDGSEVWGTMNVNYDLLQDKGIVAYATSLTEARKNPRVGENPLIIRASGKAGARFYCDVVLRDGDAQLLLDENARSHFLDDLNVVFVKDPLL